mmetsp:Transcript_29452/g.88081  ORF Transcript_29452/g.88081 Transcript_29452/m.88081 type:complete len:211 (-) Transcript_29452:26-658(-)
MARKGSKVCLALLFARAGAFVARHASTHAPHAAAADVLDESSHDCFHSTLERHDDLALPRAVIRTKPSSVDEAGGRELLAFLARILDRDEDFTVFYDLRDMRVGLRSRGTFKMGNDWMSRPENAGRLDERVKGIVLLVPSAVARTTARWLVALANPPAPVAIVKDVDAALATARAWGADPASPEDCVIEMSEACDLREDEALVLSRGDPL